MHNYYTHPCLIINICKASTQNYNSTVQVQQDAIIKFMIDYLINHRNRMRTNLFNEIINSKVSCEIVASRSIICTDQNYESVRQLRVSPSGAPSYRPFFDARHRLPHRWKRSHIDVRPQV